MEEIEGVLQEYVATANNPKYNGDYSVINSKFPELNKYDKGVLREYVATANNKKYGGDYKVINSKFPELFEVKKKDNSLQNGQKTAKVSTTTPKKKQSLLDIEKRGSQEASGISLGKTSMASFIEEAKDKKKPTSEEILKKDKQQTIGLTKQPKDVIPKIKAFDLGKKKAIAQPSIDFEELSVNDIANINKLEQGGTGLNVNTVKLDNGSVVSLTKDDFKQFNDFIKLNEDNASLKTPSARINEVDLAEISKEYEDIKEVGFTDIAKEFVNTLSVATGTGATGIFDTNPLKEETKTVTSRLASQGIKMSKEDIDKEIKQEFINRRSVEVFQSKLNKVKEELTPAEQYASSLKAYKGRTNLSEENKQDFETVQAARESYKSLLDEKKDIERQSIEMQSNGQKTPLDMATRYGNLIAELKTNASVIDKANERIGSRSKEIGTLDQEIKALSSENSELTEMNKRFGAGGLSMLAGLTNAVAKYGGKATELAGELIGSPFTKIVGEVMTKEGEKSADRMTELSEETSRGAEVTPGVYFGGLTETKSLESVNDLVNETVQTIGDNGAVVATLLATGGVGLGLLTTETIGHKSMELRKENNDFREFAKKASENGETTFEFLGNKYITKDNQNKDYYSKLTEYATPVLWGATMLLPMAKQLKYLSGYKKAMQVASKESPELIQKSMIAKSKEASKEFIGHSLGLAKDLKIMSLAQGVIDQSLGKEVDYYKIATDLKTLRDSFILHGMNVIGAVVTSNVARPYMTNKEASIIDSNSRVIFDLTNRLASGKLSVEDSKVVESQLKRLSEESKLQIGNILDRMSEMDNTSYEKAIELAKKSSELRKEAADTKNSSLENQYKKEALDKIKKEYVENEKKLSNLRENYTKRTDGFYGLTGFDKQNLIDKASKELIDGAKERGEKDYSFTERDVNIKASEIYDRETTKVEDTKAEDKNIFFYYEAKGEKAPTEVPEGYTTIKRVENSAEVKLWEKQQAKPTEEVVEEKVEPKEKEEIDISMDEIEALEKEISQEEAKEEGTLSDNLGQKIFRGSEEGMLELEGQQIVFKTGDVTNELGNVDVISGENMSSLGFSKFSPEGIKTEGVEGTKKLGVITLEGKEYKFIAKSRDKKGASVVKVKDTTSGLIKKITGPEAERILKDLALQKPKETQPIKLTVEGKEVIEEKGLSPKQVRRAEIKKAKEEFEAKSMQEIQELNEKAEKDARDFEDNLLTQISKEASKDKNLIVSIGERQLSVTKKADGEFSVSQKNKEGRFVGVKDAKLRDNAISEYNKLLEGKDADRIKLAEELSTEFKKEQEDKILKALDKAIQTVSTKGKAFDAMLGIPLFVAEQSLKIVRKAYTSGKSLSEALKDGYGYIKSQSKNITDAEFKKWALNELKPKKIEVKEEVKQEPKKAEPKEKETKETLKQDIKDIKSQVVSIVSAMREFAGLEKAEAKDILNKKAIGLAEAKDKLSKYIKENVQGKLSPAQYNSLINLVNSATVGNLNTKLEAVNRVVDRIEIKSEKTKRKDLMKDLYKALDLSNYVFSKTSKTPGKSKITAEAKEEIIKIQETWKGIDLDKLPSSVIEDIIDNVNTIADGGVLSQKAKQKTLSDKRDFITEQSILSMALKNNKISYEKFEVEENLLNGNYVVIDGQIFSKKNINDALDYIEENPNAEIGLIENVPTRQVADKIFSKKQASFNLFSAENRKLIRQLPKKITKSYLRNIGGIRGYFEDLISDSSTDNFITKYFIDPLQEYENRKIVRKDKYKKVYTEIMNDVLGIAPKGIIKGVVDVWESQTKALFKNKPEALFLEKTKLEFKINNDVNFFDGLTESHVIQAYNLLRSMNGVNSLLSLMPKGSTIVDILPIIEYVNKNPTLKKMADKVPEFYKQSLIDLNKKLDENGLDTIQPLKYATKQEVFDKAMGKKGTTEAEATLKAENYEKWLKSMYGDKIPSEVPYAPSNVEAVSKDVESSFDNFIPNNYSGYSTASGNMIERIGGGKMVANSFQKAFNDYVDGISIFIEGVDVKSNLDSMLQNSDSRNIMISNYGKAFYDKLNNRTQDILLGIEPSAVKSLMPDFINKYSSRTTVGAIAVNYVSAFAQLTSIASSRAYLDVEGKKRFDDIVFGKNKELKTKYISDILNSSLLRNRIASGSVNIDVKNIVAAAKESKNPVGEAIDASLTDSIFLTVMADASNIVYGGFGHYGVLYERLLKDYSKKMSVEKAKEKAKEEALVKFFTMAEKTQASSQLALRGTIMDSPVVRFLSATAFTGPALQTGANAITAIRKARNNVGSKVENYHLATYNAILLPALFTLVSQAIKGSDDDENTKGKVANDFTNNVLEQFSIAGKIVAMLKDEALSEIAPSVVGINTSRPKNTYEKVGRIITKFSPTIGSKVRNYDKMMDSKENISLFRQITSGIEFATSAPSERYADIGTKFATLFDSDFKFSDRLRVLSGSINNPIYFDYKKDVEGIINDSKRLELSKNERNIYFQFKKDEDAEAYKKNVLQEKQLVFIETQMNILKENGINYKKESMRYQRDINNYKESIVDDYADDLKDALESKDFKKFLELRNKVIDDIITNEDIVESDQMVVYDYFTDKFIESFKDDSSIFDNVKKQSPGYSRANAILKSFGDFSSDVYDENLKSSILTKMINDKLLDDKTLSEYEKLIKEK